MKKHRYSAKNIKQADWKQIGTRTAGRRIREKIFPPGSERKQPEIFC